MGSEDTQGNIQLFSPEDTLSNHSITAVRVQLREQRQLQIQCEPKQWQFSHQWRAQGKDSQRWYQGPEY